MGMTDQTLVDTILNNILHATTPGAWAAGTGGTALAITTPLHLRLYSVTGSETASGTEQTGTNGYTTLGSTLGTNAFAAFSGGTSSNANQVQWTATGTWASATNGIEVWDTSGTPIRILWGALTTAIAASAVTSGDTVTVAASAITVNASAW
jgi:hypothetical protein